MLQELAVYFSIKQASALYRSNLTLKKQKRQRVLGVSTLFNLKARFDSTNFD